jgi:hypothetical protein
MKKTVLLLSLIFTSIAALSQNYWSKRFDFDFGNDYGRQVAVLDDGFVVNVNAFCQQNTRDCFGLIKFDLEGNRLWSRVVYDTLEINFFTSMVIKQDTIYINANYSGVSGLEYTVLKFDLQGNYLDRFDYWYPGVENFHWGRNLQIHQDKFFVHGSYRDTATLFFRENIWAYDAAWNKLWETNIPNNGYPRLSNTNSAATADGGLAVIYASWKNPGQRTVLTVEKYDAGGQLEWRSTLPYEFNPYGNVVNITQHPDGSYLGVWKIDTFGGFNYPYPDLLFKLDADGQLVWERINYEQVNNFYDIFVAQNGDLIGCGITEDSPYDTIIEPDFFSGYIARFNAAGERLWERRIIEKREDTWFCELYGGAEMPNGDLIFTGSIDDTSFFPDPYPQNVWLLRVDGNGCLLPDCATNQILLSSVAPMALRDSTIFRIFPLPFNERLLLGAELGQHIPAGDYRAILYDSKGQMIFDQGFDPHHLQDFDTSRLPAGFYTLLVSRDGKPVQTLKAMKGG